MHAEAQTIREFAPLVSIPWKFEKAEVTPRNLESVDGADRA